MIPAWETALSKISFDKIENVSQLSNVEETVLYCINISKKDWDSFENSWDFKRHPLLSAIPQNSALFDDTNDIDLAECYTCWENECNERFNQLKANEEVLNRIFIDIYGLQDELTPKVEDKDVTVRKADLQRDIKSLVSYAVGCMFGRYSLNEEGLVYAGGEWNDSKIGGMSDASRLVKRRYIVSKEPINEQGVCNIGLGYMLGSDDEKIISYSCSTNVFSVPGGAGLNYVHGGSSPQEMLVPVLDIKMDKGAVETRPAQIMLVSLVQKITNLITSLDFIQSDPVSDVVKKADYKLYFISDNNEKISNENIYIADKRDEDVQKRLFRMRFTFKNKKYDKDRKYYLVAYDESNDVEVFRHEVIMDLAFSDNFGFDL